MGILAVNFNKFLLYINLNEKLCTIISIIFSILTYLILILKLHIFSNEEIKFIGVKR
jgi:hypothetical protein